MINYVNNSYDNVLKPCDAQQFYTLTQSEQTERLILAHRGGDPKAKSKLPAITYMGVFDKDKYRKYLGTPSNNSQARLLSEAKASVVATDAHASAMGRTQASRNKGTRKAEFMRPTGLLMMDFDHSSNPRDIYDALFSYLSSTETAPTSVLALAHITPSGDGLRLVLKREKGKSIQQEQYEWFKRIQQHYEGELSFDDVCKDISRLSYAPMKSEILYFNPSLLFGELPPQGDYPDGSLFGGDALRATLGNEVRWPQGKATPPPLQGTHDTVVQGTALPSLSTVRHLVDPQKASLAMNRGGVGEVSTHPEGMQSTNCPSVYRGTSTECGGSSKQSAEQYPTDYNGIEYAEIIRRLEEQLGGAPSLGARNSFIFTMACNLRYICNDDAAWVASILPTYGEEPQKHRQTIQSAINRPMSRTMPETLARALRVSAANSQLTAHSSQPSALPPALPAVLPEPIALLTSRTPEKMKAAVAMAVFPPLGAHLYDTQFTYIDNRPYEATFMNVVMAELSSGKSAVNMPIDYIIADIRSRDLAARDRERQWREKCATMANTKDRPERPKNLGVQVLTADMTNAAFVQRLADAGGKFLYTQMDEIELLDALKTNGRAGSVSQIIRLAFDRGLYGQERVGATSVNEQVNVRWNWNASTTIQRGRSYFRQSLADGTLSRLSFATIVRDDDDWGRNIPKYGTYGEAFADELRPYIDALNVCRGTIHCPEAEAWAERMLDEQLTFAEQSDDRAYAQISFRAVLMGFLRAMVLYVMGGMRWSDEISEFASWTVRYDMWCKMRFFGDLLHKDLEAESIAATTAPRNLLDLLPMTFTRQDAQELRMAYGRKPNPSDMLRQWLHRGFIVREQQDVFSKVSSDR